MAVTAPAELWFGDTRVSFPCSHAGSEDGISAIESVAPRGDSPPLHVHRTEDELFHVVDGTLTLQLGDELLELGAGSTALAPKGVPHTYRVDSDTARWTVITTHGDFEAFVRAASREPNADGLPERNGPPSREEQEAFAELASAHGIDLVGPPLSDC